MAEVESRISRYKNSAREVSEGENFILEDPFMIWPHSSDTSIVVKVGEAGRLDLVSYRVYNNPLLAWVLARRNNILNPLEVKVGTILHCPATTRIYSAGGFMDP